MKLLLQTDTPRKRQVKEAIYSDFRRSETGQLDELAEQQPRNGWQRRACGIGSKGHRVYDWALIDSADPDYQYMIRRSIDDGELAFYHCYNPNHAGFGELVRVAGARWPIEECFGAPRRSRTRSLPSSHLGPWHRHIALAMLAHTFLAVIASKAKKAAASVKGGAQPAERLNKYDQLSEIRPNRIPRHPSTGPSSRSPSPKFADSSTSFTRANRPSPTANPRPALVNLAPTAPSLARRGRRSIAAPAPPDANDLAL